MMAAPPQPQPRLEARLVVVQDALIGVGLVTGIIISSVSLWALWRKYHPVAIVRPSGQR